MKDSYLYGGARHQGPRQVKAAQHHDLAHGPAIKAAQHRAGVGYT